MATNTLRPTYLRTGTPSVVVTPTPDTGNSAQNNQTVYEWMDYSSQWKTNPPFLKGSAGTTMDSLHVTGGDSRPRILRGYIRRAEYALNDDASMSRLYFMYNPESISRDYMNYLDQGALDPFNTVFQSGNLVAPPSMLNFSFELFFDRQEEAMAANNRGVMVDMEYFDLVVRNVKPSTSASTNNALPDNGVMMVNPRDITVVFSPEITVQGRPLNASVTYERFTHKMIPTRMRINLQMRVVYFGQQREITTFVPETVRALESVTFLEDPKKYLFTYKKLEFEASNESYGSSSGANNEGGDGDGDGTEVPVDDDLGDVDVPDTEERPYIQLNMEAASHGWSRANEEQSAFQDDEGAHNKLQYGGIPRRMNLWQYCDCSSFIWACFAELGLSESLGWEKWGSPKPNSSLKSDWNSIRAGLPGNCVSTSTMYEKFATGNFGKRLWGFPSVDNGTWHDKALDKCVSGDIILRAGSGHGHRTGHVGIVWKIEGSTVKLLHAGSERKDIYISEYTGEGDSDYNCAVRPYPRG